MKIFNTLSRTLEDVAPIEAGHMRLYTCGPTVYNAAHIGNFRTYVFEDILRRHLKYRGFRVTQVMNLTDVDDKTIRGARQAGVSLDAYTRTYKDLFFEDVRALGIEAAEHYPAATDHVPEMIALIERLMLKGLAYRSDDGSVYFSVAAFPGYGRLARVDLSGLRAGARVAHDEYEKENVADFALWKAWDADDGDVAWESPWRRGRPGWHIECSAMSMKNLGESFYLHTGGVDNMFPHHDDEIAQSEGATGKPFVRYWMHSAHLVVNGQKMSKSLGNFFTLRDLQKRGYGGRELRYVLLSAHYRQTLNFTLEAVVAARASLARLDEFRRRLDGLAAGAAPLETQPAWAAAGQSGFEAAMDNDLGVPEALAAVFDMAHAGNRAMDRGDVSGSEARAALEVLRRIDAVLGVLFAGEAEADAEITGLVAARQAARAAQNWAESDRLRNVLHDRGWDVRDTPAGPKLTRA